MFVTARTTFALVVKYRRILTRERERETAAQAAADAAAAAAAAADVQKHTHCEKLPVRSR